jgi:hypothetical protein
MGSRRRIVPPRVDEMKSLARLDTIAEHSGNTGPDTLQGFGLKPRCGASKALDNASAQESPTARLSRNRRGVGDGTFVEATPNMGPTEGEGDVAFLRERPIAGVTVDFENALEAGEMRDRLRRRPVGRLDIGDRGRVRSAPGADRLSHKTRAVRSWCDLSSDRAPAPFSRRRTASSTI